MVTAAAAPRATGSPVRLGVPAGCRRESGLWELVTRPFSPGQQLLSLGSGSEASARQPRARGSPRKTSPWHTQVPACRRVTVGTGAWSGLCSFFNGSPRNPGNAEQEQR